MVYSIAKEIDLSRLETFAEYFGDAWPEQLVTGVASRAHQRWIQLIGEKLQTSRLAYRAGLRPPEEERPGRVVIRLVGAFPVMVEEGASPYDLHDTILKGRDHVVVPFRHTAEDAGFATRGTPVGFQFIKSHGKAEALKLGRRVMQQAKQLGPGQRLAAGLAPQLKEHHTTDIFAGLARIRESAKEGAASTFVSWRTISKSNKDGVKWMHPKMEAKRLLDIVVDDLEEIANVIADGMIEGILFHDRKAQ